ncbi:hypothetical protein DRB06_12630 [Actinomyces sp. Z5]|nr:hypothetical protein DRB06_12630 [Actinomyces sp. Z5]RAX21007.1 hypothetical protein DRB07_12365 [Actinomyces sp. Z3]
MNGLPVGTEFASTRSLGTLRVRPLGLLLGLLDFLLQTFIDATKLLDELIEISIAAGWGRK